MVRHAGPDFLPIDDKLVTVLHGPCLQRAKIGAGIGLAVALAPDRLATEDAREVLLFLLFCAVAHDRWPQEACRVTAYHRCIAIRQLLVKNKLFPEWPVKPTVFLRPGDGQPVLPAEFFGELVCESKLRVVIRVPELCDAPPWREFGLEKFPNFSTKVFFFH